MGGTDRLVAAYIEGLDLTAVWLARLPDGSIRVGTSLDQHQDQVQLKAEMLAELWCAKPTHAVAIAKTAASSGAADLGTIRQIADEIGVLAVSQAEARAIAVAAVAVIRGEIARAKIAGELRPLNRTYKTQRLQCEACGGRFPKYDLWFGAWEQMVVRTAAETARSSPAGALAYVGRPNLCIAADDQARSEDRALIPA